MRNVCSIYLIFAVVMLITGRNNITAQEANTYYQSEYVWDLTEIYTSDNQWEQDYEKVNHQIETTSFDHIKSIRYSNQLANELDAISNLRKRTSKVAYYAILRWEEGKAENGEMLLEKGERILANFEALISPMEDIISNIEKSKLRSWINENPRVFKHRHWLNLILDQSEYRSSPEVEYVLRTIRHWISSSVNTYWEIQGVDKIWPRYLSENGDEMILNRSAFRGLRRSNDYQYRDKGARLYYESLNDVSDIMGELYINKIKSELDLAKIRGFSDGINANWLLHGGVPVNGYKVLLSAARNNKNTLQRYSGVRSKVLNKEKPTYLDFFKTPDDILNYQYGFSESMNISVQAAKLIGDDFYGNLKTVLNNKHWMHLADVPKTASYHIRPPSGDIHPFLILKYKPSIAQARALTGGLFDLASSVPSIGADGTDVQEVPVHISGVLYAGGILFGKTMASNAVDKKQKIGHLVEVLEYLRRFFKNAILMELDAKVQSMLLAEQEISGSRISEIYLEIMRDYYGHNDGVMNVSEYLKNDWMTETAVLFMPKYEHHFWAPSIAVAVTMIEERNDKAVRQLFLQSFSKNKYDAYSTLKASNIDLMDEKTYDHIFKYMNDIMDEIDLLLE
ncbi:MAG: hypothetical protein AAF489_00110 [Bacteroidota bacterium]